MTFAIPCPIRSCDYIAEGGDGISAETDLRDHLEREHDDIQAGQLRVILSIMATDKQIVDDWANFWKKRWRSSQ